MPFHSFEGNQLPVVLNRTNSDAAKQLDQQLQKVSRRLHRSVALGAESVVRGDLANTYVECSEPNWDGFNALPVSFDSFLLAERFLIALPLGIKRPCAGAEPDGQMTLEWYSGIRRTISISFDPEGKIHYAALMGASKAFGTESFVYEIPDTILELIQRVC